LVLRGGYTLDFNEHGFRNSLPSRPSNRYGGYGETADAEAIGVQRRA
jgi:hypothetical protein